jgi:hypothetical protein
MSLYHPIPSRVWTYPDRRLTLISPSETLRHSNDTERTSGATSYEKIKAIFNGVKGCWRVKFDLRTTNAASAAYGRIYRNGSPYGTEQTTTSTTYVTFSEDLIFTIGDSIELYIHTATSGAYWAVTRNFRLYGDGLDAFGYNIQT